MPEAQDGEAKQARLEFGVEDASNGIALVGPEVQDALAVARNRVVGGGEVKKDFAVLADDGSWRLGEE
ncbi:MAG TPA: hypothetical protein VIK97_03850, partial [Casimicrobiaceae bacterium]